MRERITGDRRFAGRAAFVTGAASGIGLATAALLESLGATVTRADLTPGPGLVRLDVADEGSIVASIAECARAHGRLDVLVNAAGVVRRGSSLDVTGADWNRVHEVNLRGTFSDAASFVTGQVLVVDGGYTIR